MDGIDRSEEQAQEANDLYWGSETSVNQIANRLGLSKGSLYAAIQPLPSDSICPLCQARLVYMNRTALEKGHLQCAECSTTFEEAPHANGSPGMDAPASVPVAEPIRAAPTGGPAALESPPAGVDVGETHDASDALAHLTPPSGVDRTESPSRQLMLSTTLLGLGLGLLIARVVRR